MDSVDFQSDCYELVGVPEVLSLVDKLRCHAIHMQMTLNVVGHIPGHERYAHLSYPVKSVQNSLGAELAALLTV